MSMTPATEEAKTKGQEERVTLAECPIGLFLAASGALCLKTEYGDNEGRIDAYIVESGEFFWGGSPQSIHSQRRQMVRPVPLEQIADAIHLPFKKMVYASAAPRADSAERTANVAQALRLADWGGVSIGNKALIAAAISELEAAPAPAATPGVPDSLRKEVTLADANAAILMDRARNGGWVDLFSLNRSEMSAAWSCLDWVRALIAAHPAGQSTGQGAEEIKSFGKRESDALMQIIHALDDLAEPWLEGAQEASGTGEKDYERRDMLVHSVLTSAGNALIKLLRKHGPEDYFPRTKNLKRDPYLLTAARDHIRTIEHQLSSAQTPAPDSTRTGQVEAGQDRLISPKMTPEQERRIAHNLCGEFGPDAVIANVTFVKAFYDELYAAALPAAPEAQGAWRPIETAPRGGLVWLFEPHHMGGFMFAGGWSGGGWFNNLDCKDQVPTHWMPLPAPPGSSGQESA